MEKKLSDRVMPGNPDYDTTVRIMKTLLSVVRTETIGMDSRNRARFAIGGLNSALTTAFIAGIKPAHRLEAFDDMMRFMRADIEESVKGTRDG